MIRPIAEGKKRCPGPGCMRNIKTKEDYCKKCSDIMSGKKKFPSISPRSKTRKNEEAEYIRELKKWLPGRLCERCKELNKESETPATENHHKKGREGLYLLLKTYWMAVCRTCHIYIESHPDESYKKGWMIKRGSK